MSEPSTIIAAKTALIIGATAATGTTATGVVEGNMDLAWAGVYIGAFSAIVGAVAHIYGAYERRLNREADKEDAATRKIEADAALLREQNEEKRLTLALKQLTKDAAE